MDEARDLTAHIRHKHGGIVRRRADGFTDHVKVGRHHGGRRAPWRRTEGDKTRYQS